MSKTNFAERRQALRAKRILTIRHRLIESRKKNFDKSWHNSLTEDMSALGIAFRASHPYSKGEVVEVNVVLAGVLDIFNGFASVVRSEKINEKFYKVAVKFSSLKNQRNAKKYLSNAKVRVSKVRR